MLIDDLLYALGQVGDASNLDEGLMMAVRFQIDNVAHYLHEELRDKGKYHKRYNLREEIPNIAPLAPVMWFEYNGLAVEQSSANRYGCLLSIDYDREHGHTRKWDDWGWSNPNGTVRWVLRAEYFSRTLEGILAADWVYLLSVAEDGQFLNTVVMPSQRIGPDTPKDHVAEENARDKIHAEILNALVAICFAHCKGTEIEEHQPSRQVRRAAERARKPIFTFHTIDIEPSARVLRTEGHINENGLARALHICRGHFAHYTAEKPLFGKYTGTFYRPMHLRGKVEQGVSVKDYRVHPMEAKT